jgi:hypothetical protein
MLSDAQLSRLCRDLGLWQETQTVIETIRSSLRLVAFAVSPAMSESGIPGGDAMRTGLADRTSAASETIRQWKHSVATAAKLCFKSQQTHNKDPKIVPKSR